VLWAVAGRIAHRLARPFAELTRVAQELGSGRPSRRVMVRRKDPDEIAVLGTVFNDMSARIEKQMADQRELLAGVSHEIRTPLARIRLLVELARESGTDEKTLGEIDREVVEIDALVSELLASSRLDFAAMTLVDLEARDVASRALDRAGIDATKLDRPDAPIAFRGDPTLLARALANLLQNAHRHGGGVDRVVVKAIGDHVQFAVEDAGPGIAPGDNARIFDSFYQRADASVGNTGALGLGLALVSRIARAHGGVVFAGNRAGGGARIGFELPRTPPA
jgi:signal transduction histidine kinase